MVVSFDASPLPIVSSVPPIIRCANPLIVFHLLRHCPTQKVSPPAIDGHRPGEQLRHGAKPIYIYLFLSPAVPTGHGQLGACRARLEDPLVLHPLPPVRKHIKHVKDLKTFLRTHAVPDSKIKFRPIFYKIMRDGRLLTSSPHRPRLVVSRSTCPPLSPHTSPPPQR
jgi:hypothetical protein